MRMTLSSFRVAATLTLLVTSSGPLTAAQSDAPSLYVCAEATTTKVTHVGLTVCDSRPTEALEARAETENLQIRAGALIVELDFPGIAAAEGLQPGDMIYRVGGADVDTAAETAVNLERVVSDSDTVVNFLRGGRPYRVKLRR